MLTSAILVLGKQKQEDCYKFETSLGYRETLRQLPQNETNCLGLMIQVEDTEWKLSHWNGSNVVASVCKRTLAWSMLLNALSTGITCG